MRKATPETSRDGTAERTGDHYVVRFERRFDHPIERVWSAITDPREIEKWLAAAKIEARPGGAIELRWLNSDEGAAMRAKVTTFEPPRLFEWSEGPHGHPAEACRWELRPDGDGCVLTFTNTLDAATIDAKAAEDPEHWSPPSLLAGWHLHLDYLGAALEGGAVDWKVEDLEGPWSELYDRYRGEHR